MSNFYKESWYSKEEKKELLKQRMSIYASLRQEEQEQEQPGFVSDIGYGITSAANQGLAGMARAVDTVVGDGVDGEFIQQLEENAAYGQEQLSDTQKEANQKRFITEDEDGYGVGDAWTSPRAYSGLFASALGSQLPMMAAGGPLGFALKAGLAKAGATKLAQTVAGATAFGAAETAMVTGGVAGDIKDGVEAMPDNIVLTVPSFKENLQAKISSGIDEKQAFQEAKDELGRELAVEGMKDVAPLSFLFGTGAGFFLDKFMAGKLSGKWYQKAGKGVFAEGPTEGAQGATEHYVTQSKLAKVDPTIDPKKGMAEAGLTEALGGGMFGGAAGAISSSNVESKDDIDKTKGEQAQKDSIDARNRFMANALNAEEAKADTTNYLERLGSEQVRQRFIEGLGSQVEYNTTDLQDGFVPEEKIAEIKSEQNKVIQVNEAYRQREQEIKKQKTKEVSELVDNIDTNKKGRKILRKFMRNNRIVLDNRKDFLSNLDYKIKLFKDEKNVSGELEDTTFEHLIKKAYEEQNGNADSNRSAGTRDGIVEGGTGLDVQTEPGSTVISPVNIEQSGDASSTTDVDTRGFSDTSRSVATTDRGKVKLTQEELNDRVEITDDEGKQEAIQGQQENAGKDIDAGGADGDAIASIDGLQVQDGRTNETANDLTGLTSSIEPIDVQKNLKKQEETNVLLQSKIHDDTEQKGKKIVMATGQEQTPGQVNEQYKSSDLQTDGGILDEQKTVKTKKETKIKKETRKTGKIVLPKILKQKKNAWINSEFIRFKREHKHATEQALKTEKTRLKDSYNEETDKAHATLSFEDFNALNKESSESLNRQAYDSLREEYPDTKAQEVEPAKTQPDTKEKQVKTNEKTTDSTDERTDTGRVQPTAKVRKDKQDILEEQRKVRGVDEKQYHPAIKSYADGLVIDGGIATDKEGKRNKSLNPEWYIDNAFIVKTVSGDNDLKKSPNVKIIKNAVNDYNNSKKITKSQERILEALSEVISAEEELAKQQFNNEQEVFARELNALIISGKGSNIEQFLTKAAEEGRIETYDDIVEWQGDIEYAKSEANKRSIQIHKEAEQEELLTSESESEREQREKEQQDKINKLAKKERSIKQKEQVDKEVSNLEDELLGKGFSDDIFADQGLKVEKQEYPLADKNEWYGDADYEARGGVIEYISPDEYINMVRPLDIDESSRDNIDDLKQHIESGRTLDPLAIYEDGSEDGRHRAYAAKELGIKQVPVIFFSKEKQNTKFSKSINKEVKNLAIVHNLTSDNLEHADKMGGLAVPSIAVVNKDFPLSGFGEISLVGSKEQFAPSGATKIFDADIYSPTYPTTTNILDSKAIEQAISELSLEAKKISDNIIQIEGLEGRDGVKSLARSLPFQYEYLKSIGKEPKLRYSKSTILEPVLKKYTKGYIDYGLMNNPQYISDVVDIYNKDITSKYGKNEKLQLRLEGLIIADKKSSEAQNLAQNKIYDLKSYAEEKKNGRPVDALVMGRIMRKRINSNKFEKWLKDNYDDLIIGSKIFDGYTYSGKRKYLSHNLSNVVRIMKRGLRGKEGFSFGGAAQLRSQLAKQFKTIAGIKADRNKLVSEKQMDSLKEESNDKYFELKTKLNNEITKYTSGGEDLLEQVARTGWRGVASEFGNISQELQTEVDEFLELLRNYPTEYFEGKVQRAVDISEFDGAVVPLGKEYAESIELLKKHGIINIKRYKYGDAESRAKAVNGFKDLLFSKSSKKTTGTTVQQVIEMLPRRVKKMVGDDLKIVQSWNKLPKHLQGIGEALYHTVWHGTPHEVDKFTTSKIGTGEGAQAYGYGLYFTDTKKIAEWYRKNLSENRRGMIVNGSFILDNDLFPEEVYALQDIERDGYKKSLELNKQMLEMAKIERNIEFHKGVIAYLKKYKNAKVEKPSKGRLYKVDLKPKQEEYLLWDKPLFEQSNYIKSALNNSVKIMDELKDELNFLYKKESVPDNLLSADWLTTNLTKKDSNRVLYIEYILDLNSRVKSQLSTTDERSLRYKEIQSRLDVLQKTKQLDTPEWNSLVNEARVIRQEGFIMFYHGDLFYENLVTELGSNKEASDLLSALGVKGNKYLDSTSRSNGDGGYNYVIFSDEDITIQEKFSKDLAGVEGLYDPKTNTTYLIADMINKDNINSILSHELLHYRLANNPELKTELDSAKAGLRETFDNIESGKYKGRYKTAYEEALKRVDDANTNADDRFEEWLAYQVTIFNKDLKSIPNRIRRQLQKLISAIKLALRRVGIPVTKLTPADLNSLAMQAVSSRTKKVSSRTDGDLALASKQGYKGSDVMEAKEWNNSVNAGLDMSKEARMKRAKEMGFDTKEILYHGSSMDGYVGSTDIKSFDKEMIGDKWNQDSKGFFFTDNKQSASFYASAERDYKFPGEGEGAVYPVHLNKGKNYLVNQSTNLELKNEGAISYWDNNYKNYILYAEKNSFDSITLNDGDEAITVVFEPNQIRSINAAFNPAYKDSGNLLASKEKTDKEYWEMTSKEYAIPPTLKENKSIYVKVGDKKIEVIQNPTDRQMQEMRKEAIKDYGKPTNNDPVLRSTEDNDGNKYYWKSFESIHAFIEPSLSKTVGTELNQNASSRPSHRGLIRRALYEGKNVPTNVSKEYPGLVDEVLSIPGNKVGKKPLFSYAGKESKSDDKEKLSQAVQMEKDGYDSEEIRFETGWFLGIDDKWRFEIDDSQMDVSEEEIERLKYNEKVPLSDLIMHNKLFGSYPELSKVIVSSKHMKGVNAQFDNETNEMVINKNFLNYKDILPKLIMHETQHKIQEIEGFAEGGSPADFKQNQEKNYEKLAGEIEARDVEDRLRMTPEERENHVPYQSQGIAKKDAIVMFGDGKTVKLSVSPKEAVSKIDDWLNGKAISKENNGILGLAEESRVEKAARMFQDGFNRVKILQKTILERGGKINDESNVYLAEERSSGITAARLKDLKRNYVDNLIKGMADKNITIAELDRFVMAKFAPERNAYIAEINPRMLDGGSGITNAQAQKILTDFEKQGITGKLESLAGIVYEINDNTLNTLVYDGLIDTKTYHQYKSQYEFYVPLKGKEGVDNRAGTGQGYSVSGSGLKSALGRGEGNIAESPVAHSIAQAESSIIRAEKNKIGQVLMRLMKDNPDPEFWTVTQRNYNKFIGLDGELFEGFDSLPENLIEGQDVHRVMGITAAEKKLAKAEGRKPKTQVVYKLDPAYKFRDDVFSVMAEGKLHQITIKDTVLAEQLKKLNANELNNVIKGMGSVNRWLAMVNTAINPEFVITNLERDLQTAGINLAGEHSASMAKQVMKDVPSAIKGIWLEVFNKEGAKTNEWSKLFRELEHEGGTIGFFGLEDIETKVKKIEKSLIKDDSYLGKTKEGLAKLQEVILDANQSVENASRLAAYKAGLDNGMSKKQAASLSKNLTVNFNRRGELAPILNSAYLFANASIQGTARIFTALKHPKVRKIVKGIATTSFALAMYNMSAGGDDEDGVSHWEKISDYTKQTNLIFMHPDGSGDYSKFKLPYGYNAFWYSGIAIHDLMFGKNTTTLGQSGKMLSTVANAFNPIQGADLLDTITPTILKPIEQDVRNINFMMTPIKPENPFDRYDRPESDKSFLSTNKTLKDFSKIINTATGGTDTKSGFIDVSPETIKHYIGWVTGGAGMTAFRTAGTLSKAVTGETIKARDVPLLRTLGGTTGTYYDTERFYNAVKDVEATKAQVKKYKEERRPELRKYLSNNRKVMSLLKSIRIYKKRIKTLRVVKNNAIRSGNYKLADRKREEIAKVMRLFLKKYDVAKK